MSYSAYKHYVVDPRGLYSICFQKKFLKYVLNSPGRKENISNLTAFFDVSIKLLHWIFVGPYYPHDYW